MLKKVVSDRRAALDEDTEIRPAIRKLVKEEFVRSGGLPIIAFPQDGAAIPDTPRLTLVVVDLEAEWQPGQGTAGRIAQWTRQRGAVPRLYPASLATIGAGRWRRSVMEHCRSRNLFGYEEGSARRIRRANRPSGPRRSARLRLATPPGEFAAQIRPRRSAIVESESVVRRTPYAPASR